MGPEKFATDPSEADSSNHIYSKVVKPKKDARNRVQNDAVTVVPVAPVDPVSVVNVSTDDVRILSSEASSTIVTVGSPHVEDFNVSIASPSEQVMMSYFNIWFDL